jgi:hypothetical protein
MERDWMDKLVIGCLLACITTGTILVLVMGLKVLIKILFLGA